MESISPTLFVLCVPLLPTNPVLSLPGISRENSTASARPGSAMSGASARTPGAQVRLRSAGARRPRPMSIATTGMTSSMYEERQKPALVLRDKSRTCEYLDILCILCQQSFVCSLPFSREVFKQDYEDDLCFSEHSQGGQDEEGQERDLRLRGRRQRGHEVSVQCGLRDPDPVKEDSEPGQGGERCQEVKGNNLVDSENIALMINLFRPPHLS